MAAIDEDVKAPLFWKQTEHCIDLRTGELKHFPAGSYDAQMKKRYGALELSMMKRFQKTLKAIHRRDNLWDSPQDEKYFEQDTKLLALLGLWGV